ncbi:MAG: SDR family oxidoreductase [Ignavibacteria bacterium]|nr:SDR family oxidoreductase [Ignavibacteria bacterium]
MKKPKKKKVRPAKIQLAQPGLQHKMKPQPQSYAPKHIGSRKLEGKIAIITGGDSGIGRAVAIAFAREGCDVSIVYLNEHKDAKETKQLVENEGRKCLLISGDIQKESFCRSAVQKTHKEYGRLDIIVNNAAVQFPQKSIEDITAQQLFKTFSTNIFSYFYIVKAAMKFLKKGASIINTASVTAYRGSPELLDYSSTKGAIVSFTRSLSGSLIKKGIRVNGVAPGPIWTPLIPASFPPKKVSEFGSDTPMERAGQPEEVAPAYVFLASEDSAYITGQIIHPNGGEIING